MPHSEKALQYLLSYVNPISQIETYFFKVVHSNIVFSSMPRVS